jgi:hypothetical protein
MDYWPALGMLGILSLWSAIALVPWFALLIARRGEGVFLALPVVVAAGIAGGALTPTLGGKGWLGFEISLLAALTASAATIVVLARWPQMHTDEHR